jgi:hypothetical protein
VALRAFRLAAGRRILWWNCRNLAKRRANLYAGVECSTRETAKGFVFTGLGGNQRFQGGTGFAQLGLGHSAGVSCEGRKEMSQEGGEKVVLNIYDLSQGLARQLSASLLGKVIEGIWHTGVVVYGNEYYFGGGIQKTPVGQTPYGRPLKTVGLGYTQLPKEVFEDFLNEISPRYTQATYNVLRHNCNNFSEEIAQFLVGTGIPEHILGLPDEVMNSPMGGMLLPMIQQLETTLKHNQAPAIPQRREDFLGGAPNFSGVQVPPSAGVSFNQTSSPPLASLTSTAAVNSTLNTSETLNGDAKGKKVVSSIPAEDVKEKKESLAADQPQKDLGDARAKVHEEITREFMELMASGSLRASEAAALAARRVMARHGIASK